MEETNPMLQQADLPQNKSSSKYAATKFFLLGVVVTVALYSLVYVALLDRTQYASEEELLDMQEEQEFEEHEFSNAHVERKLPATVHAQGLCLTCANSGENVYDLLSSNWGGRPYENPTVGPVACNPDVEHLQCVNTTDLPGGTGALRFDLFLGDDCEASGGVEGRERNEIKTYGPSPDELKGFAGETVHYSWKFKVGEDVQLSNRFFHIMQVKVVGGSGMPALTISGRERSGQGYAEVIYNARGLTRETSRPEYLTKNIPWSTFTGQWIAADVRMTLGTEDDFMGHLTVSLNKVSDGSSIWSFDGAKSMWNVGSEYYRPKWGLYRSVQAGTTFNMLNDASMEMADICINKD